MTNLKRMEELHNIIRPLVDDWLDNNDDRPYCEYEGGIQCLNCDKSLCFYDDIDPCCHIGFAGQEFLCPIIQKKNKIEVPNFNLPQDIINEIREEE